MKLRKLEDIDDIRDLDPDDEQSVVRAIPEQENKQVDWFEENAKKHILTMSESLKLGSTRTRTNFDEDEAEIDEELAREQAQAQDVANRDYHLVRMMFQIELMDNTKANKMLRSIGEETIMSRLPLVRQRFGAKRLNKEDFHNALEELIGIGRLTRAESDVFFEMFDTNMSNGIDEQEFIAGIRMTLHDQKRSLASHCRRLMDARQALGTVITMMEIELMLRGVAEVARHRYPGIDADCKAVIDELEPQTHHSQVPMVFFRAAIQDTPVLSMVLKEMGPDASLPPLPSPPPSPDPAQAMLEVAREVASKSGVKRHRSNNLANSTHSRSDSKSGSEAGDASGDKKGTATGSAATISTPTSRGPVVDIYNRRFRADENIKPGQEHEPHPPEPHNPLWYQKNGVVWRTSDITGPMTMT